MKSDSPGGFQRSAGHVSGLSAVLVLPSSFDGYPIFSVMPSCQIPALRVMGSFCPSLKPMVSPRPGGLHPAPAHRRRCPAQTPQVPGLRPGVQHLQLVFAEGAQPLGVGAQASLPAVQPRPHQIQQGKAPVPPSSGPPPDRTPAGTRCRWRRCPARRPVHRQRTPASPGGGRPAPSPSRAMVDTRICPRCRRVVSSASLHR